MARLRPLMPRTAIVGTALALGLAAAVAVGAAAQAGAVSIPVTGSAQGTAHMEFRNDGECTFHFDVTLTFTSGPLAGGTLHHDLCWGFSGLEDGNRRATLGFAAPPPDGTFYSGEVTSNGVTACNGDPGRRGCGQTGDWLSETRVIEFFDRAGARFGPAAMGELTLHSDSTFLDPIFYDGTFEADLSVSATYSGQLHD